MAASEGHAGYAAGSSAPAAPASAPSAPAVAVADDSLAPADLKIIICGDSAVGKSKLVERFLLDDYSPRTLSTYALTLFRHNATEDDGRKWSVDFWDTAGQEQFDTLHASYYFQANACILAFDVTRKVTYKNLETWFKEVRQHCPEIPCICVANKIDVEPSMAKKRFNFAVNHQLPFYFVSASDGTNVVRVFKEAVKLAVRNKEQPPDEVMAEIWALLREDDSTSARGPEARIAFEDGEARADPSATPPAGTPEPTEVSKSTDTA
jgi:Rab-like protein 2